MIMDFLKKRARDPFQYVINTKSSYYSFVYSVEENFIKLSETNLLLLVHFCSFINNGKSALHLYGKETIKSGRKMGHINEIY